MNVLLTTSAAPENSPFSTDEKRPPLGVGFLISVLRNAGHKVYFIDNYLRPSNFLETDYLLNNKIDYVGIYANTICYRDTLKMFQKLNNLKKNGKWRGKILVGGPHTSVALETIPDFVDYIVQGEGEKAILDIVEGKVLSRVIRYPRIENLDDLPMPAWDYFVNLHYDFGTEWFNDKPVFVMNTSRGCPFRCSFCSVGSIWGKRYTYFDAERIVNDIEYLIKSYGAKGIYFREDNFTFRKERVIKFCNILLEKNIRIKWACESRVDTLDKEIIKLMAKAGCKGVYFGVESGSQRELDFLKKGITIEQIEKVFGWCKKADIKTYASFIVGVPTETEQERVETVCFAQKLKPTTYSINVFVGVPKSELYEYTIKNNLNVYNDEVGLVYLKWHNDLVDKFYGGRKDTKIPFVSQKTFDEKERERLNIFSFANILKRYKISRYYFFIGRNLLGCNEYNKARRKFKQAVFQFPFSVDILGFYLLTFLPLVLVDRIRLVYKKVKRI